VPFKVSADTADGGGRGSPRDGDGTSWDLMLDGAIPTLCDLIKGPCDLDILFYSLGSLTAAISLQYSATQNQVTNSS
jgi:hypothetical protein